MFKRITALLMVIVLSAGVGYAAGNGKSITVYYDTIKKIMINNQDKTPRDVKPFIYEGTTYVPLRYIAEQLNQPVYYDAASQSIYIGSRPKMLDIETKSLFSLPSAGMFQAYVYRMNNSKSPGDNVDLDALWNYPANYKMTFRTPDAYGGYSYEEKEIGMSTRINYGNTLLMYNLNQEYDLLTGMVGFDGKLNDKYNDCTINFIVNNEVKQQIKLTENNPKEAVNLLLTGGATLKIEMLVDGYENISNRQIAPYINLTDMTLEKHAYK